MKTKTKKPRSLYIIEVVDASLLRNDIINSIIGSDDPPRKSLYVPSGLSYQWSCDKIVLARVFRSIKLAERGVDDKKNKMETRSFKYSGYLPPIEPQNIRLIARKMTDGETKEWVQFNIKKNEDLRSKMVLKYDKILGNLSRYVNWE